MKMRSSHIGEDLLDQYAMGTLPAEESTKVEEHFLLCPFCQERLKETDQFLLLFRAAATQVVPRPTPVWRRPLLFRNIAWAAAATAVLVSFIILTPQKLHNARVQPTMLQMQSLRGPNARARVASGQPYLLVFDVVIPSYSVDYEIEIVNAVGHEILKRNAKIRDGQLTALVDRLDRGSYWVRVFSTHKHRDLVAEYGLLAE
jgi:hypothetical protein